MSIPERHRADPIKQTWRKARRWLPSNPQLSYHWWYGRHSGYERCCVVWFCLFAWVPDAAIGRLWSWLRVPAGAGFIPCPLHYALAREFGEADRG